MQKGTTRTQSFQMFLFSMFDWTP